MGTKSYVEGMDLIFELSEIDPQKAREIAFKIDSRKLGFEKLKSLKEEKRGPSQELAIELLNMYFVQDQIWALMDAVIYSNDKCSSKLMSGVSREGPICVQDCEALIEISSRGDDLNRTRVAKIVSMMLESPQRRFGYVALILLQDFQNTDVNEKSIKLLMKYPDELMNESIIEGISKNGRTNASVCALGVLGRIRRLDDARKKSLIKEIVEVFFN